MGEIFNSELKRVEKINKYNKQRASRMLDDMATAYISGVEHSGLDKSLTAVRTAKKALRMQGFSQDFIDDFFLQTSYLSKKKFKQIRNELLTDTIYSGQNGALNPVIENLQAREQGQNTTDLLIETLKSRPELISALERGVKRSGIKQTYKINAPEALIKFYNQHKELF